MKTLVIPLIASMLASIVVIGFIYSSTVIDVYLGPDPAELPVGNVITETRVKAKWAFAETLLRGGFETDLDVMMEPPDTRDIRLVYFKPRLMKVPLSKLAEKVVGMSGEMAVIRIEIVRNFNLDFDPATPTYMPLIANVTFYMRLGPYEAKSEWQEPRGFMAIRPCGYGGMFVMGPAIISNLTDEFKKEGIEIYSYVVVDGVEESRILYGIPEGGFLIGHIHTGFTTLKESAEPPYQIDVRPPYASHYAAMQGAFVDDPIAERRWLLIGFNRSFCAYFKKGVNTIKIVNMFIMPAKALEQDGFIEFVTGPVFIIFYRARKVNYLSRGHVLATLMSVFPATFIVTMLVMRKLEKIRRGNARKMEPKQDTGQTSPDVHN